MLRSGIVKNVSRMLQELWFKRKHFKKLKKDAIVYSRKMDDNFSYGPFSFCASLAVFQLFSDLKNFVSSMMFFTLHEVIVFRSFGVPHYPQYMRKHRAGNEPLYRGSCILGSTNLFQIMTIYTLSLPVQGLLFLYGT